MKAPSPEQREAMARLQFTRDGKALYDFLVSALDEASQRIVGDDDPHRVRVFQGECRTLRDLIKLLSPVSS
jgi:hypothetical protein